MVSVFRMAMVCALGFVMMTSPLLAQDLVEDQEANAQQAPVGAVGLIAETIKQYVENVSSEELYDLMRHHYVRIHMLDRDGNWRLPEFEAIADELLPPDVSTTDALDFVDRIAVNLDKNEWLVEFLNDVSLEMFDVLSAKINSEGAAVIPDVVAWAMALENITKAHMEDPTLLGVTTEYWIQERKNEGVTIFNMGLFGAIKLQSVQAPINQLIKTHQTGKLDPKLWRGMLPLNIFEAVLADKVMGYWDNAKAGWALWRNAPGEPVNDALGTGPATFTDDLKRIEIRMALPEDWADLYQVWNMAFLTQISNYPYWIVKLLIPQVSDYEDRPEEYIYRRAVSLYTSEQYIFLGEREDKKDGIAPIDWADKQFTKAWGKANAQAASEYLRAVDELK